MIVQTTGSGIGLKWRSGQGDHDFEIVCFLFVYCDFEKRPKRRRNFLCVYCVKNGAIVANGFKV